MIRRVIALAALAVPLAAVPQARAFDSARGLVASYPLDGDATDEVHGTPAAAFAVRAADGRDGRRAGALGFDGRRSYVNLGDHLDLPRFTVSAWIRPDAVDRTQVVVSRIRNEASHFQKNLELRLEAGGFLFLHVPSGAAWEAVQGARPIPAGRWTHVAATYDGQRAQLWVDGARDGAPLAVTYQQTRTETFIGARPEGGSPRGPTFFFAGAIEDVRLWDRGLSEPEVATVAGRAPPPEPPRGLPEEEGWREDRDRGDDLVAHWPLDRAEPKDVAGDVAGRTSARLRAAEDRRGDPAGAAAFTGKEWLDAGLRVEPERFTVAAWVRPARVDREQVLLSKRSTAYRSRERWLELRLERGGRVVLSLPAAGGVAPVVRSARALAPGRWAHVAASFDGGRAVIWVDGEVAGEATLPVFEASRGALFLGARPDASGRGRAGTLLDGRLDEVRLYRGVLDAREIGRLAGRAPPAPSPYPGDPRPGDDEDAASLLVRLGRELVRFDAAVARRDAGRIAAAEDRALRVLEDGARDLRDDRGAGPLLQRLRRATQELQSLRGRTDATSLDRKRAALTAVTEALWDDLAMELDRRPL